MKGIALAGLLLASPCLSQTALQHVASNAALASASTATYSTIVRDSYAVPGDAPPITYVGSSSACSITGGDGGSQVPSSNSKCWIWIPPSAGVSPQEFGAVGNGTAVDRIPLQNAINAASTAGVPLLFDKNHLFKIDAALNIDAPIDIEGAYRYGIWTTNQAGSSNDCSWGILNTGVNINALNVTAYSAKIRFLCIDMTGQGGSGYPTSGAAINISPPDANSFQTGVVVEYNSLLNVYDGITINGNTNTTCCGQGTAADGVSVSYNTIGSPVHNGISIGKNTVHAATSGVTLWDNNILCNSSSSRATGTGVAVYDGNIDYNGTTNGPELCHIGMAWLPGHVGTTYQYVGGAFRGVLADNSGLYGLLIQPQASDGLVQFVDCEACWASSYSSSATGVRIDGATYGGTIAQITFHKLTTKLAPGQTVPGFDVQGGSGGLYDIQLNDSLVCPANSVASGSIAARINLANNANNSRISLRGNHLGGGCPGVGMGTSIGLSLSLNGAVGNILIADNDFSQVFGAGGTPIAFTADPSSSGVIITNNLGVDDQLGNITNTSVVALNNAFPLYFLSGSGTVGAFSGGWTNRIVTIRTTSGFTFDSSGTTGSACGTAITVRPYGALRLQYWQSSGCWSIIGSTP